MKILIVNDDSISAPGIAVLAKAAKEFGEVWVVAPASQCSAMSQKLTLTEPLALGRADDFPVDGVTAWQVGGTPVDCVKVALSYLMEGKPDFVFSGINNGYNAGFDISYSGTLGAAFEAVRGGIPAMAFSIASNAHLQAAEPFLAPIIRELMETPAGADAVWNVNFPALKTRPLMGILRDRVPAPVSMYMEEYIPSEQPDGTVLLTCHGIPTPDDRIPEGTDADAVRKGYISVGTVRSAGC